jgi:hypothetical protein
MQIPKIPVVIGVLVLGAALISFAADNPAQAAARAALDAKLAELNAMPEPTNATSTAPETNLNSNMPVMESQPSMDNSVPMKMPKKSEKNMTEQKSTSDDFKPIVAPALPISATKEQRLGELLQKYKADLITPQQYQDQREAILSGS